MRTNTLIHVRWRGQLVALKDARGWRRPDAWEKAADQVRVAMRGVL